MSMETGLTKEDLYIRMAELQNKLKNSEEERRMLEKTCEILIKAFKEEQRVYFNTLNNKYEEFLEDCNIRQRRNDVIKRSLNKIEDKAKAVFAKTQKLKILKDRYLLYLKENEFLKAQECKETQIVKNAVTSDAGSKSVHWKIPIADSVEYKGYVINLDEENQSLFPFIKNEVLKNNHHKFRGSNTKSNSFLKKVIQENLDQNLLSFLNDKIITEIQNSNDLKSKNQFFVDSHSPLNVSVTQPSNVSNKNSFQTQFLTQPPQFLDGNSKKDKNCFKGSYSSRQNTGSLDSNQSSIEFTSGNDSLEKSGCSQKNAKSTDLEIVPEIKTNHSTERHESIEKIIKLMKDDLSDDENENEVELGFKVNNKYQIIENEKKKENENSHCYDNKYLFIEIDKFNQNSSFPKKNGTEEHEKRSDDAPGFNESDIKDGEPLDETSFQNKTHLKGLDGVDYENETYPESYYEQPVRPNNFSSLASKVILEEDEYELEEEENEFAANKVGSIKQEALNQEKNNLIEEPELQSQTKTESTVLENKVNYDIESVGTKNDFQVVISSNNHIYLPESSQNYDDCIKSQSKGSQKKEFFAAEEFQIQKGDSKNTDDSLKLDPGDEQNEINKFKKSSSKSNLIHLLESDSESFQIEHGEMVSGYDDSDFDFSFKQDPE